MGLIWTDNIDSFGATADLLKKYANANVFAWGSNLGRNGGPGLSCVAGNSGGVLITPTTVFPGTVTGIFGVGFYVKFTNAAPSALSNLCAPIDGPGNQGPVLGVNTNRALALQPNGSNLGVTGGTTSVCDGNFHFIEWKFNLANANNIQAIYIDGVLELSISSNQNTSGRAPTAFRFLQMNNGIGYLGFGPWWIYDSNGAPNATTDYPLGMCSLGTKRPSSDAVVQFTPNSGVTNFSRVNEVVADDDVSYVETGVSGNQDLYGYTPLPNITVTPAKIWGAMLNSDVENPVAGTFNSQGICKSGATQQNGAVQVCPTSYSVQQQSFNLDPNGNVTWTLAALDAANFGFKAV